MYRTITSLLGLVSLIILPLVAIAQENSGPIAGYCPTLSVSFGRGSSDATTGGQVTQLQRFLADYYDLNPADYVSGYFGRMTQQNVMRFQSERGIAPVSGFVGPLTRAAIASVCSETTNSYSQSTYYSQALYTPTYSQAGYYSQGTYSTNATCTFNGQTVAHGQSVTAYQASSVAAGSSCASQTRTCSNGTLSGSYTFTSCGVQAVSSGYPDNADILVYDGGAISWSGAIMRVLRLEHPLALAGTKLYVDGIERTNVDLVSGGKCSTMAWSVSKNPEYVCVPSVIDLAQGTHTLQVLFGNRAAYPTASYSKTVTVTVQ